MKLVNTMVASERGRVVIFFMVVATVVLWPIWQGRFYAVGDMREITIPLELFFHQELQAGRLPAWHPDVSWGFPVIASAQIGFFYPVLLVARLLPVWLYLPLILFGHVLAVLCGTYLFLRRRVSAPAAITGSLAFGLSAYLWQHLTHLNIFLSVAWLPWQLLAADYVLASLWHRRGFAWLAAALGFPFLIGQLQVPLLQALFVAAYIGVHGRTSPWKKISRLVLVAVVVSLVASAQVIPTLELLAASTRGTGGDFDVERANQHSFPLYHVPTVVFPRFFGHDDTYWGKRLEIEYGVFIGTLPLILGLWATILYLRHHRRYPDISFWVYGALISFLLALGGASPVRWLGLEPSLWFFSAPARWLLFTTFSGSVLAAYGLDFALRNVPAFTRFARTIIVVLAVTIVTANIAIIYAPQLLGAIVGYVSNNAPDVLAGRPPQYYHEKVSSLLASLQHSSLSWRSLYTYFPLGAAVVGLFALRRRWLWTMLAITAVELGLLAGTTTPMVSWQNILTPPETLAALPQNILQKQARIISLQAEGDTGAYFTNPASRPNDTNREQQRQLLLPLLSAQYGVSGITWPASLDLQKQALALASLHAGSPATFDLGKAAHYTVGAVLMPATLGNLNASFLTATNDIAVYSLPAAPRAAIRQPDGHEIPVPVQEVTASHIQLTVDSPCDCDLIVRDSWYPGWLAFIDGSPVPIEVAEDIFRGLRLSPGRQQIDMVYRPARLYGGISLSIVGLAIILFLLRPSRVRVN